MSKRAFIACTPKFLPPHERVAAARVAVAENPANAPAGVHTPERIGVLTTKYWGAKGVVLTVSFLESTLADLRDRILSHMNSWQTQAGANVKFAWTSKGGQVRITRGGDGYWSYLGPDILSIPAGEPTMCLQGFTMRTPESEYKRVVRHETGHTLGFPHEHTRRSIVQLLDPAKTIAYFARYDGWDEATVREQILTPLDEGELMTPTQADVYSIMAYQFDGSCTKNGQPVPGGLDIDATDAAYAAKIYPLAVQPPPPPPEASGDVATVVALDAAGKELWRAKR